jgi:TetR/AcrR family transcriptional repressor of nem operon
MGFEKKGPRVYPPEKARQRILDSARDLFFDRGYGDVSVRDICEGADVRKGSFYHHFETKHDLLMEVVRARARWIRELTLEAFAGSGPPSRRLADVFGVVERLFREDGEDGARRPGGLLCSLALELAPHDEEVRTELKKVYGFLVEQVEKVLEEAVQKGELNGTDPALRAREVLAYFLGTLLMVRVEGDFDIATKLAEGASRMAGFGETEVREPR